MEGADSIVECRASDTSPAAGSEARMHFQNIYAICIYMIHDGAICILTQAPSRR